MIKCENCDFWRRFDTSKLHGAQKEQAKNIGTCYLKPPVLFFVPMPPSPGAPNGSMGLQAFRPQTNTDDGCSLGRVSN